VTQKGEVATPLRFRLFQSSISQKHAIQQQSLITSMLCEVWSAILMTAWFLVM